MENKQTAVEWLYNRLQTEPYLTLEDFKQAKAMEKQQIMKAWMATDNELQRIAAEQYYNETFNTKEK